MIRKIIHIDEEKCNGCGACVTACHEGAIGLVNGKAKLMRDDYCDGFGDCLPGCPTGAITFEEREAAAYDEQAVLENKQKKAAQAAKPAFTAARAAPCASSAGRKAHLLPPTAAQPSQLRQWPCQIKLVPVNAPYFDGAKAPDRSRLHRLRLRQCARRVHEGQDHPHRLPQAGCCGLQ